MTEFDKTRFIQLLQEAPARRPLLEEPKHSAYLQKQVFDKLRDGDMVDLRALDLDAVSLGDLIPEGYPKMYEKVIGGWARRLNQFIKETPSAYLSNRTFF